MAENQSNSDDNVFIATRTAHVDYEGRRTLIRKGKTRVAAGHDLVKKFPDLFEAASSNLQFDVEDTVSRPGIVTRGVGEAGRRGTRVSRQGAQATPGSEPPAEPYKGVSKKDLEAEVEKRNAQRDDDHKIVVEGKGNVPELKAALVADDEAADAEQPTEPSEPVDLGEPPHKENQTDTTSPVAEDGDIEAPPTGMDGGDGAGDS